ncbi:MULTISPECIES: hypothetical protein [unclassified Pseudomonas]|jgi:hypothetical protein|uniref:hypothetical protein n=1 Tax=unclassified Pseudomonas TaxID=196821 RepID=UPI001FF5BF3C|nr:MULTISPECIES: hypothetical protein [unclassified Pseudomonas]
MYKEFLVSNVFSEAYIDACVEALDCYDLGVPVVSRARGFFSAADEVEVPATASVVRDGLITFSGNLTDQNRKDAQNAYHYASLVATKMFPLEHQGKEWYAQFCKVMGQAGWMSLSMYYNNLNVSGTSVRMDKLVLEILASIVTGLTVPGPSTALMLKTAGDAIAALQKRDTALTLYERNILNQGVGGVTVGSCIDVNGTNIFAIGTVRFTRGNSSTKVLFVDTDVRNVGLYRGETAFEKNETLAEATRQLIASKIVAYATETLDYDI